MLRAIITITVFSMGFFYTNPLFADWAKEKKKIEFLISKVGKIDGYFVRNGTEHSPAEAVKHLKMKLKSAQNSWFAPSKEKWTVKMFIEKVASGSSLSGKPYIIKFKNGKVYTSRDWLYLVLKKYKKLSE